MTVRPKVELVPWSLEVARRLVGGQPLAAADTAAWHPSFPTADTVDAVAMVLSAYEVAGPLRAVPLWWVYGIRDAGQVVGHVGFHGPPVENGPVVLEIGYAVVPPARGRGVASRACALLLELAWRQGADALLAETGLTDTGAENLASQAVLRRCGFLPRPDGGFGIDRPTARPTAMTS